MLQPGTYRGVVEGRVYEFRLDAVSDGEWFVSGDVTSGAEFIVSFTCAQPQLSSDGSMLNGNVDYRGNAGLFTGTVQLVADERGTGSFQLGVDMEGGHRDLIAGRLDWEGSFLRRLVIEIDGLPGTEAPGGYSRNTRDITIQSAFEAVGFDVSVIVDSFDQPDTGSSRGYTLAEVHAAMERRRGEVPADRLHAHVFVCSFLAGRDNRGVLGVMYDFGEADLNRRPREGVAIFYDHPLLSDPRTPAAIRDREYLFTVVHEVGHALNLLHSFDKSRPAALSWMNYPNLYPRGYEAASPYDGTADFWRHFEDRFDDEELRHLRHASPREIRAGGFAFGTYEEGLSVPFGGTVDPRRTTLGANPLRAATKVALGIKPLKKEYHLGEPVFVSASVENTGPDPVHIPDALDPSEGYLRLFIRNPSGHVRRYRPPVRLCKKAQQRHLRNGDEPMMIPGIPLMLGAEGPLFTEPGTYVLVAQLVGIDGTRTVQSAPASLRVRVPDAPTESIAEELWSRPGAMQAMYLRHPLVAHSDWNDLESIVGATPLLPGNTLPAYCDYVSGLGWMTPFDIGAGSPKSADPDAVRRRFRSAKKKGLQGLPTSAHLRVDRVLGEDIHIATPHRAADGTVKAPRREAAPRRGVVITSTALESARVEIPPAGLFGSIGIAGSSQGNFDPFERVVNTLRGKTKFADIVSWNIEHLHSRRHKIPRIASLIRDFRCDFWGLQEVDEESLAILVETLNSGGHTPYAYQCVEGKGQQSGILYRTDTTRVRRLPVPKSFRKKIDVKLKKGGVRRGVDVFLRDPFLCEVTVRQGGGIFDFRCAVVHLKSTDTTLADTGNAWRLAAAHILGGWIEELQSSDGEREYLILGDMNAETARQGLKPFHDDHRLLSVGMQKKYGSDEALTRVASQRLLDHIVVTADAVVHMPPEDIEEQLIIRSDKEVSAWTKEFSDHVPVAVRFVLSKKDTD